MRAGQVLRKVRVGQTAFDPKPLRDIQPVRLAKSNRARENPSNRLADSPREHALVILAGNPWFVFANGIWSTERLWMFAGIVEVLNVRIRLLD